MNPRIYISSMKLTCLLTLIAIGNICLGQATNLKIATDAAAKQDFAKAKSAIDEASKNPETMNDIKTWYYRGYIYKEIYKKSETGNVASPSRMTSFESLKKAISIDEKHQLAGESKKIIAFLNSSLFNDGVNNLNAANYKAAFEGYTRYIELLEYLEPNKKDTSAIFYAGYSAYMDNNLKDAKTYLQQAQKLNYNKQELYLILGKIYWTLKEQDNSFKVLDDGHKRYPNNKDIILLQINQYLEIGKIKVLEEKLQKAIALDDKNIDLYMMLALVYEKLSDKEKVKRSEYMEKARLNYTKVLELDPNNYRANYNLGIFYYNSAVAIINDMPVDEDLEEMMKVQDECVEIFKKAEPYMLKAESLDPRKIETLEGLSGIYFALNEPEKSNAYKEKVNQLKK